jgi:DNA replication protein DnaC
VGYQYQKLEANIPPRFGPATLDDYIVRSAAEDKVKEVVTRYIGKLPDHLAAGRGVFFAGSPGIGKTMLSCIIGNAVIRIPKSVHFTTLEGYIRRTKRMMDLISMSRLDESVVEEWKVHDATQVSIRGAVKLLILDDVGKEYSAHGSDYAKSEFDFLLRYRFDHGLATVITTNLSPNTDAWAEQYSKAMQSFLHEACVMVPFGDEEDRRMKKENSRAGRGYL